MLSKVQDWEALPGLIDDDVLHQFVTIGTYDTIGQQILDRYRDVVTDCEFSIAVKNDDDRRRLAALAQTLQGTSDGQARRTAG